MDTSVLRIIVSAVPQGGGEHLLKSFVAYGIRSGNTTSSSRSPCGLMTLTNYTSYIINVMQNPVARRDSHINRKGTLVVLPGVRIADVS